MARIPQGLTTLKAAVPSEEKQAEDQDSFLFVDSSRLTVVPDRRRLERDTGNSLQRNSTKRVSC